MRKKRAYLIVVQVLIVLMAIALLGALLNYLVFPKGITLTQVPCQYKSSKNALGAFSPRGILTTTTADGLAFYYPDPEDGYEPAGILQMDDWYKANDSSVGGLTLRWDEHGIIIGPDMDGLRNGLTKAAEVNSEAEMIATVNNERVRVKRLRVPSLMSKVGDIFPYVDNLEYAYDPQSDCVIGMKGNELVYKSTTLSLAKNLLTIFHDLDPEEDAEARNLWLTGIVEDKLVCVSQIDGEVLLLSRDLKSVERLGSISRGSIVWQPSCLDGVLAAAYGNPRNHSRYGGDYILALWAFTENRITKRHFRIDLRNFAGNGGWYPAVALRDAQSGAIVWGNTVVSFSI
jgi:hypothetical protein